MIITLQAGKQVFFLCSDRNFEQLLKLTPPIDDVADFVDEVTIWVIVDGGSPGLL